MKRSSSLVTILLLLAVACSAQSYSVVSIGLVPSATATDLFTVTGSASKEVHITRIIVSCTQTTAGAIDLVLLGRSTADTLGTSTSPTIKKHDTQNAAATATVNAYTANPTVGTLDANIRSYKLSCLATSTATPQDIVIENFVGRGQDVVLRGTGQVFVISLNSQTVTGGSFDISIEWYEK